MLWNNKQSSGVNSLLIISAVCKTLAYKVNGRTESLKWFLASISVLRQYRANTIPVHRDHWGWVDVCSMCCTGQHAHCLTIHISNYVPNYTRRLYLRFNIGKLLYYLTQKQKAILYNSNMFLSFHYLILLTMFSKCYLTHRNVFPDWQNKSQKVSWLEIFPDTRPG